MAVSIWKKRRKRKRPGPPRLTGKRLRPGLGGIAPYRPAETSAAASAAVHSSSSERLSTAEAMDSGRRLAGGMRSRGFGRPNVSHTHFAGPSKRWTKAAAGHSASAGWPQRKRNSFAAGQGFGWTLSASAASTAAIKTIHVTGHFRPREGRDSRALLAFSSVPARPGRAQTIAASA